MSTVAIHTVASKTQPLYMAARVGDRVTILVPNGIGRNGQEWKEATGRVVMKFATHCVLNMGGRFGTPGIASEHNTVRVRAAK